MIKLQVVYKRYLFVLMVAAASILLPFGVPNSFAQGPMVDGVDGNGTGALSSGAENALAETVLGPPESAPSEFGATDFESPDIQPFTQTQGSATPQSSATPESSDPGGASGRNSQAGAQPSLGVNPITGLVSASGAAYTPLTGEQRWQLYWKMNYLSLGAYFGPFFSALVLDQATSSPYQWGGGFDGYARRVGSRTASAMLQGSFQAPLAYFLHEDVRYIVSKRPGFKHRAAHALAYSFLTYNASGRPTLNVANLSAYYASTAVTTAWLPGHYRVISYTLSNSSEQIILTLPINLLQEFWPEVRRTFRGH